MLCLTGVACLPGCSENHGSSGASGHREKQPLEVTQTYIGEYPIRVICTTGMVADLVKNVGAEQVQVSQLMPAGTDPHQYQASPGDIRQLNDAEVIFYSGLHLEGKMSDIFERMARRKPAFAVTEYIEDEAIATDAEGAYDPHLWFDVSLWSKAVGVVRDVLVQFDPPHAEQYRERADAYQAELAKLHEETRQQLATVPKPQRVLVTAHDAFNYFGRAYEVEVLGIQGISTVDEPGVKRVNELVNLIVERKIKAVFVETSVSDENIQGLVEGCQAKGHKVAIGGELFSDAMGPDGTPEGTYPGMIRHNVRTIVKALK